MVLAAPITGNALAMDDTDVQTEQISDFIISNEVGSYVTEDTATGYISGRISNAENADTAADIEIRDTQSGETVATTTSGTDGSYLVEVEADRDYRVVAEAEGYENGSTTVSVAQNTTATANIVLQQEEQQTGYISGDVVDGDNRQISDAEVTIANTQTGETVATTTSGTDGSYLVEVEADRDYRVVAEVEGYENGSTTVSVAQNTTATADVVLTETNTTTDDVEISTDTSGTVTPGDEIEVTLTLTNTGNTTAGSGGLELEVPQQLSVEEVTGDGENQPDRFYLDPISPGDSVSTTYTFTIPQNASTGTVNLDVTGSLRSDGESYSASTTVDIEISAAETVDVELSANSSGPVMPGNEAAVTLILTNTGSTTAGAGGLEVMIPDRLSLVDVAGDGENQPDRFYIEPISPNDSVSTTYTLKAPEDAAPGTVSFDVTGTLTADGTSRSASTTADIEISDAGLPTEPGEPEFIDVLQVINAYTTKDTYNGVQVEFIDVLEVISAYNAR
jgi:uncharacterized membrane protein